MGSADGGDSGRDDAATPGGTTRVVLVALGSEQATGAIIEGWGTDAGDGWETAGNSRNHRGPGMAIADVESAGADSSRSADVGDSGRNESVHGSARPKGPGLGSA